MTTVATRNRPSTTAHHTDRKAATPVSLPVVIGVVVGGAVGAHGDGHGVARHQRVGGNGAAVARGGQVGSAGFGQLLRAFLIGGEGKGDGVGGAVAAVLHAHVGAGNILFSQHGVALAVGEDELAAVGGHGPYAGQAGSVHFAQFHAHGAVLFGNGGVRFAQLRQTGADGVHGILQRGFTGVLGNARGVFNVGAAAQSAADRQGGRPVGAAGGHPGQKHVHALAVAVIQQLHELCHEPLFHFPYLLHGDDLLRDVLGRGQKQLRRRGALQPVKAVGKIQGGQLVPAGVEADDGEKEFQPFPAADPGLLGQCVYHPHFVEGQGHIVREIVDLGGVDPGVQEEIDVQDEQRVRLGFPRLRDHVFQRLMGHELDGQRIDGDPVPLPGERRLKEGVGIARADINGVQIVLVLPIKSLLHLIDTVVLYLEQSLDPHDHQREQEQKAYRFQQ